MPSTGKTVMRRFRAGSNFRWPARILGPKPGLKEITVACWGLFAGFVAWPLLVPVWLHFRAGDGWDYLLPCDFIYFYAVGRIAHEYPISRLYDYGLLVQITNEIFDLKGYAWGPSPYPPFVALFFGLFARIPFLPAYVLWMTASLALYLSGIAATVKGVFLREPLKTSLVFCFALGFYPFVICTLKNGQLSAVAVFAVGMAIFQERNAKPFAGGVALSILAYKPTLLLLVLPMLLLTRRFRMLGGFFTGGAVLILLTTLFGGVQMWPIYIQHSLGYFHRYIEVQGQSELQLWDYVDLHSFSYAVPGGRSTAGLAILACLSIVAGTALALTLWRSAVAGRPAQDLAWAATITWTLLLNFYVPVWDSILVVIALILTLRAMKELELTSGWVVLLALAIFAVTWNVVDKSNRHGSQRMMALLFILGSAQLFLLNRTSGRLVRQTVEAESAR